jgi:hypothetical protein
MCNDNNKIMVLDSRDRQKSTDSPTDYVVHLQKPITNCGAIELKEVIVPWTIYNISAAKANHQLSFLEAAFSDVTITIADGFYSTVSLCAAIETAMDAATLASQTFTVTYDTNTMKVTITASATATTIYGSNSAAKTTGLEREIGFTTETTSNVANTSPNVPKLLSPEYLLLTIDFIADNVNTLDDNKNASFVLSTALNASSDAGGTVVHLTAENSFKQIIKTRSNKLLQHFRISLRDESNTLVEMNGCDWSAIIQFSCNCIE